MSAFKSHRTAPVRVFDHLYDPVYATSGARDIWRQNGRSLASSAQVGIRPVYATMFTDLPWRPRNYYVPQRNALPFDNRPVQQPPSVCQQRSTEFGAREVAVGGGDRAKFFRQPISNAKTLLLRLQLDTECECIPVDAPAVEAHQERGCQTLYRVQSAQTKPWMPDAIIGVGGRPDTPELVYVAELLRDDTEGSWPGVYEAELVARARKRRAWERSLPAIASWEDWERRRVVLEAFEWEEWVGRENRIEYCQRLRLGIVQRLMAEREGRKRGDCGQRVMAAKERLEAERTRQLLKMRTKHRRRLRRLDAEHNGVKMKYLPVDVITEHIDPASALYAPPLRFGKHPKHRHFVPFATRYVAKLAEVRVSEKIPMPVRSKRKTTNEELQELYDSLKSLRSSREATASEPICLKYTKRSSTFFMETPNRSDESLDNELDNQMATFLQKLLKGRAIQRKLYSGRNKYRELIAEFQTSHQLTDIREMNRISQRPNRLTESRKAAHSQQMRLAALLRAEAQIKEVTGQAISTTISFALDLLDSEMVRLVDQKKAHALCMLAETERYRREAVEAGHRQLGDSRRRFHEEVARNVATSRQNTVCNYLEDVLVECVDKIAEKHARDQIRATVQRIDREANNPDAAVAVDQVLERFVLPDVFKRIAHENYLADVHEGFFGQRVEDLIERQRRTRINKLIEAAVSPRDGIATSRSSSSSGSELSDLAAGEDPAHHEAMHCIQRVLRKALRTGGGLGWTEDGMNNTEVCSILDDIVMSVIPDETVEGGESSVRSQQQEQLTDIVTGLKSTLLQLADEDAEVGAGGSDEPEVEERSEDPEVEQAIPADTTHSAE